MDSLERMNEAMHYIEKHLTGEIDFTKVAQIAYCSEYHFKRMFSFLAGIPLSEYIRRRRMTLAAVDLKENESKVMDTALKYGYDSPNSFARAFQQLHGIMPSEVRHANHSLKAYPRMTFQLTIKGVSEMNVRIVEKEAFQVVGVKHRMRVIEEGVDPEVAQLWERTDTVMIKDLKKMSNVEPYGLLHIVLNYEEDGEEKEPKGELDYYFAVATTMPCPQPYTKLDIGAFTWAIFEIDGDWEHVQDTWERIYTEWFPSSPYEHAYGPEMLSSEKEKSEIWVPVVKTSRV